MITVLLIDDDRDDAELLQQAFEEIDPTCTFRVFEESRAALAEIIDRRSFMPNLILLDINIPILNGWECLERIRNADHLKNVPVFLFTTSSRQEEKDKAIKYGATGFLTKPSNYRSLVSLMETTIKGIE